MARELPNAAEAHCPPKGKVCLHSPKSRKKYRESLAFRIGTVLFCVGLGAVLSGSRSADPSHGLTAFERLQAAPGQLVRREHLPHPIPSPQPVADAQRIRRLLPVGYRAQSLIQGGFVADLQSHDAEPLPQKVAFAFELQTTRTIESNDGRRIVEVRRFDRRRLVKLITGRDTPCLKLGPPGVPLLSSLDHAGPSGVSVEVPAERVAEAILEPGSRSTVDGVPERAMVRDDSLGGKAVRITYVDGLGVESIEALVGTLTAAEIHVLFHTPVLFDCYLFPNPDGTPDRRWPIDAAQLVELLEPALRGIPDPERSNVFAKQKSGGQSPGAAAVTAQIGFGGIKLVSAEPPWGCAGHFTPGGFAQRKPECGRVETICLAGTVHVLAVSQDYFLFDEILHGSPDLTVSYHCRAQESGERAGG